MGNLVQVENKVIEFQIREISIEKVLREKAVILVGLLGGFFGS